MISPRKDKAVAFQPNPDFFPINVECRVTGFDDDPGTIFNGYFRRLENHECLIFQYEQGLKFRLVHLVYLGNLSVILIETGEKWEYYAFSDKRKHSLNCT